MEENKVLYEDGCNWLLEQAARFSRCSNCTKAHFGSVLVPTDVLFNESLWEEHEPEDFVVGVGYNKSLLTNNDCECLRNDITSGTKVERCYAIHSEQFAILDGLARLLKDGTSINERTDLYVKALKGFSLVIARTDAKTGEELQRDVPGFYCTLCARMAKFVLLDGYMGRHVGGLHYMTADEMFESAYNHALGKVVAQYARFSEEVHPTTEE